MIPTLFARFVPPYKNNSISALKNKGGGALFLGDIWMCGTSCIYDGHTAAQMGWAGAGGVSPTAKKHQLTPCYDSNFGFGPNLP